MKKIDNQGSTLLTVAVLLLVVAMFVVGLQTMVANYVSNSYDTNYQQQVYLSSRSVATSMVEYLESSSQTMQEDSSLLEEGTIHLLNEISVLDDGDTIDVGEITFNNEVDLQGAIVKVTLLKQEDYLIVESIALLRGYEESIKAKMLISVDDLYPVLVFDMYIE